MAVLETRLDQTGRGFTPEGREIVEYHIDQFPYFTLGMQPSFDGIDEADMVDPLKTTSEVRFSLFWNNKWVKAGLPLVRVISDCGGFEVVTAGIHSRKDLPKSSGELTRAPLWEVLDLINYDDRRDIKAPKKVSDRWRGLFRSEVKPFLTQGLGVNDGFRVYNMDRGWGSDGITIVADNRRESYHQESLDVYYEQDPRDGDPIHIVRLAVDEDSGWYFEKMQNPPTVPTLSK